MKKLILPFLLSIFLSSCTKIYREVYTLEKYPVEWDEEIILPGEHLHYEDNITCEWKCMYFEVDTFCYHIYDTIPIYKYVKTYRVK